MISVEEEIENMQQELLPEVPDDALETLQKTTEELIQSGLSEQAVGTGDRAPDVELPVSTGDEGDTWSLSESLKTGPVVLNFYRGGW